VKTAHASLSIYLGITVLVAMLKIEIEREEDGRWIGEVPALPGVLAYGKTEAEARARAIALALRVIADRIDNGEPMPDEAKNLFAA
jgi:predicted RNase H-like HicB family nuclease